MSDCRSRGREFDSGPVPILLLRLIMKYNFYGHSPPFHWLIQEGLYKRKFEHEVFVNHLVKLAKEKSVVRWTDHPYMTIAVDWDIKHQTEPKCVDLVGRFFFLLSKQCHLTLAFDLYWKKKKTDQQYIGLFFHFQCRSKAKVEVWGMESTCRL